MFIFDLIFIIKWYIFGRLKIGRKVRKKKAIIKFQNYINQLPRGALAIDAGANVGEFTKILLDKGFEVHSFEPDPIALSEINKLKINNNLILYEKAVGITNSKKLLFRYRKFDKNNPISSQGSSLLEYRSGPNMPSVEINVINFIDYLKSLKVTISLLKMDIEGSEIEILNAMIDEDIHSKVGFIFVETHERFSHALGLDTAKLKLRIQKSKINNVCLDWV